LSGSGFAKAEPGACVPCQRDWIEIALEYVDGGGCADVAYTAVLTDSCQSGRTTGAPLRWTGIPGGCCEFRFSDFLAPLERGGGGSDGADSV